MVDVGFSLGSWFTVCFMGHRWLILFFYLSIPCCLWVRPAVDAYCSVDFLYSWDIGRLVVEMCYGKASRGRLFWRGVMCDLGLWGRFEVDV